MMFCFKVQNIYFIIKRMFGWTNKTRLGYIHVNLDKNEIAFFHWDSVLSSFLKKSMWKRCIRIVT